MIRYCLLNQHVARGMSTVHADELVAGVVIRGKSVEDWMSMFARCPDLSWAFTSANYHVRAYRGRRVAKVMKKPVMSATAGGDEQLARMMQLATHAH